MAANKFKLLLTIAGLFVITSAFSQVDSTKRPIPVDSLNRKASSVSHNLSKIDSVLKFHSPRKAAIRSTILPGLGQVYNKKYWKVPIVYGALGTTAVIFFSNLSTYKALRFAYQAKYKASLTRDPSGNLITPDSTDYFKIRPDLLLADLGALRSYRNEYRKNIDYSVLVFILFWGLNVADAAVDAHLKTFDVSPDLSFHLRLVPSQLAGTIGLSLVLALK